MADVNPATTMPVATRCERCQSALSESERVPAGDRVFCRTCFDILKLQVRTGVAAMSQDINYLMAAVGAILGGTVGALAWWGITAMTKIGFGLMAVVIGLLVGHGALRFAGGKRSVGLQGDDFFARILAPPHLATAGQDVPDLFDRSVSDRCGHQSGGQLELGHAAAGEAQQDSDVRAVRRDGCALVRTARRRERGVHGPV